MAVARAGEVSDAFYGYGPYGFNTAGQETEHPRPGQNLEKWPFSGLAVPNKRKNTRKTGLEAKKMPFFPWNSPISWVAKFR